jgi:hypothetical protein
LRRLLPIAIIALAAVAYLVNAQHGAARRAIREALRDELRIVTIENCTLERFGSAHDGGYLLCGNLLEDAEAVYSYGIATEDNWGCAVSRQSGLTIHQYDCFTPHRPTCDGGRFQFHDECVGDTRETRGTEPFDTLPAQIAGNGDGGKRLLIKMDVEGAEWEALSATPDAVLDRIDQFAMELHGTDEARILETVRRLKRTFYLANLNFNNWSCRADLAPLPAWAYQVLWVNKRVAVVDADAPSPGPRSRLNAPDNANGPDCQLN